MLRTDNNQEFYNLSFRTHKMLHVL